jgi:hypothetical protein
MPLTRVIPPKEQTTPQLWFGISWFSAMAIFPLLVMLPMLRAHDFWSSLTFAGYFILPGFIFIWEVIIVFGAILPSARELRRRKGREVRP